jgi:hypothetical protein
MDEYDKGIRREGVEEVAKKRRKDGKRENCEEIFRKAVDDVCLNLRVGCGFK